MLDKLITNETLVRMTRAPHFNAKSAAANNAAAAAAAAATPANGFRNMLPPLTNGKTSGNITTGGGGGGGGGGTTKCTSNGTTTEVQPRRSVITLKTAPGPTVNSSGTGVLKSKDATATTDAKSRGPRSRKRSRDGDAPLESSDPSEKKDEPSLSASEIVEPTKRRRRGKGSRKLEKKSAQAPPAEAAVPRLRSVNSASTTPGILDIYGLRSRTVDLTTYEMDVPLDKLLSGEFVMPQTRPQNPTNPPNPNLNGVVKNENNPADLEMTQWIEKHLNNVMEILPKPSSSSLPSKFSSENDEDVKVRMMLDLERPFQPEDEDGRSSSQRCEDRNGMIRTSSLDKAKAPQPFRVQSLPLYSCEEFRERLRLPETDLETLIANARPSVSSEHPGTSAAEKSSKFEGIPPSPASFSPVGVAEVPRAPRNGRSAERHWDTSPSKKPESETSKSAARVKEEEPETKKGQNSGFPTLHVKVDDGHHRHLGNLPVTPNSPGVQAAAILLCNMANSDAEKELGLKGKRPRVFPGEPSHRFSKVSKVEDDNGNTQEGHGVTPASRGSSKEVSTSSQPQTTPKKNVGSEKRKSLSQVNHSLSKKPTTVAPQTTTPVQGRSSVPRGDTTGRSSSTTKVGKGGGGDHGRGERERESSKEDARLSLPLAACKWGGSQAAVKSTREVPQVVGKVKLVNGVTGSSPKSMSNSNSRSPKTMPSRNDNISRSLSSAKSSEAAAGVPRSSSSSAAAAAAGGGTTGGTAAGGGGTVALKSSRRTSTTFVGEVKQQQRSKHDLRASKLSRESHR